MPIDPMTALGTLGSLAGGLAGMRSRRRMQKLQEQRMREEMARRQMVYGATDPYLMDLFKTGNSPFLAAQQRQAEGDIQRQYGRAGEDLRMNLARTGQGSLSSLNALTALSDAQGRDAAQRRTQALGARENRQLQALQLLRNGVSGAGELNGMASDLAGQYGGEANGALSNLGDLMGLYAMTQGQGENGQTIPAMTAPAQSSLQFTPDNPYNYGTEPNPLYSTGYQSPSSSGGRRRRFNPLASLGNILGIRRRR